jgi:hypothetical protein
VIAFPKSNRPDAPGAGDPYGDEGVASAETGGRTVGRGCDRRGRRSQARDRSRAVDRSVTRASGGCAEPRLWNEFEFVAVVQDIANRRRFTKVCLVGFSPQCEPIRILANSGAELDCGVNADHLARYVLLIAGDEHSDRVSHDRGR